MPLVLRFSLRFNRVKEKQICFPSSDGLFMLCNYIVRKDGRIIQGTNGFLKFPLSSKIIRKKKEKEPDETSDSLPSNNLNY